MPAWPERDAVFDAVPCVGVPPHTRRAVVHRIVEVEALADTWANVRDGWPLVIGRTRCGKSRLELDRTTDLGSLCRRCFPPTPQDPRQTEGTRT